MEETNIRKKIIIDGDIELQSVKYSNLEQDECGGDDVLKAFDSFEVKEDGGSLTFYVSRNIICTNVVEIKAVAKRRYRYAEEINEEERRTLIEQIKKDEKAISELCSEMEANLSLLIAQITSFSGLCPLITPPYFLPE